MWKQLNIWAILYCWITYVVPNFRYGALVFCEEKDLESNRCYENYTKASKEYIMTYNKIVKLACKLPRSTAKDTIRNLLTTFSAEALIYKSYYMNA